MPLETCRQNDLSYVLKHGTKCSGKAAHLHCKLPNSFDGPVPGQRKFDLNKFHRAVRSYTPMYPATELSVAVMNCCLGRTNISGLLLLGLAGAVFTVSVWL